MITAFVTIFIILFTLDPLFRFLEKKSNEKKKKENTHKSKKNSKYIIAWILIACILCTSYIGIVFSIDNSVTKNAKVCAEFNQKEIYHNETTNEYFTREADLWNPFAVNKKIIEKNKASTIVEKVEEYNKLHKELTETLIS